MTLISKHTGDFLLVANMNIFQQYKHHSLYRDEKNVWPQGDHSDYSLWVSVLVSACDYSVSVNMQYGYLTR